MKRLIWSLPAFLLVACAGDEGTGVGQQALCESETRADTYAVGLTKSSQSGMFDVRLMAGMPAPPDRGDNAWTLELRQPDGTAFAPVNARMKAWMPDHGHGTNPLWNAMAPMASEGQFEVGPFDLFMGGYWEFTIEADDGTDVDEAKLSFCLEG